MNPVKGEPVARSQVPFIAMQSKTIDEFHFFSEFQ